MTSSTVISKILMVSALSLGLNAVAMAEGKPSHPDLSATPRNTATENQTPGEASADEVKAHRSKPDKKTSDAEIIKRIKAALAKDNGLQDQNIAIETKGGVARITGTVSNDDVYKKTVATAEKVEGVTKVEAAGLRVKND